MCDIKIFNLKIKHQDNYTINTRALFSLLSTGDYIAFYWYFTMYAVIPTITNMHANTSEISISILHLITSIFY